MQYKRSIQPDLETIVPILINTWRRFRKEGGPADLLQTREFRGVVAALKTLQVGLHEEKSFLGKDYFADHELLGAYLLYPWVIHYQQALSLLGELPIQPKRVLDVCSGAAPMAFAALRHGANEVIATDQNTVALELGADICGRYGLPISVRQWSCLKQPLPVSGSFDLIILGHCLEELFPSNTTNWMERQQKFIDSLLQKLTPHGFLLIVDSSLVDANRRILQLRDALVTAGVPVQAPCIWKGACPALQAKDSPCYAQRELEKPRLVSEMQRALKINLGSLKMSYLLLRSPKAQWPQLPEEKLYRIVSPPVETFQGKRYYLCGSEGKKNLGSHISVHTNETRAFEFLRRGELISIENALEKQHSFDIVQGTTLKVEAACGKPIPEIVSEEEY
ncbi:MAG: class I SAM-dependent methyltransferase [Parachlamydiaceae bacterium]|nr:class I SAM-dependent methyltransferase [Parachlamydiaceae bacterium]